MAMENEYRVILQEKYVTKDKFSDLETITQG